MNFSAFYPAPVLWLGPRSTMEPAGPSRVDSLHCSASQLHHCNYSNSNCGGVAHSAIDQDDEADKAKQFLLSPRNPLAKCSNKSTGPQASIDDSKLRSDVQMKVTVDG